jgi:D-glycero-D-manno-heptose 1,7-bisphosphate phosphatase
LVEQASRELGIDPRRSYVVGDQWSDVELAHRVGAKGILVLTGHGAEAAQQKAVSGRMAEAIVRDLYEAVDWILKDLHSTRLTHEEGIFSNGA